MLSVRRLLPSLALLAVLVAPASADPKPFRYPEGRCGDKNELKYINGLPVLVVEGDPKQIGEAVGALALKPSPRILEYPLDLLKLHKVESLWAVIARAGAAMYRQFPADYRAELEAMTRAAGADQEKVIVGNTFFDLKKVFACSAVMIESDRSAAGGPMLGRNLDYPSLGYIHQHSLVTVYRPRGKHAFASVGFPGLIGCLSGMNDAGLSVAVLEVVDVKAGQSRFDAKGVPYALCFRQVLEECATIAEAKKALTAMHRTSTLNLALADRDGVAVFEITPDRIEQRRADQGVCTCTNHFCSESIKAEKPFNPVYSFERFAALEAVRKKSGKLTPDDLRKELDAVNLGDLTLQTMVFEPATLKLHLAVGGVPASKEKLRTIDLKPLFRNAE
jgi:predicted choloylglycine hydrolase